MIDTETTPKIFLTDYGSYNEGTQFEFGHWVELSQFDSVEDYAKYEKKHFENADKKRPLFGGIREEVMITDFEGFPREFYSESSMDFERLFNWINASSEEQIIMDLKLQKFGDSESTEEIHFYCGTTEDHELFEMYYPESDELTKNNPYLQIDYAGFVRDCFTAYTVGENTYYVED